MGRLRFRRTPAVPDAYEAKPTADGPIVPWISATRDPAFPALVSLSLFVHATIFLPSLLRQDQGAPPASREISVEIVQLPPKPVDKPVPKPVPPKPVPPKPAAPKPAKPRSVSKPQVKESPKTPASKPMPQKIAEKPSAKPAPSPAQDVAARLKSLLGPMPVVALPGASGDGTEEVSYSQLVLSKVAKAKKEGRYRGIPGAASVAFTIGDAGEVARVAIVRPSGDPSLDAEAVAMINRGAPYPAPPPGARRDYTITLRFEPLI